MRPLLNMYKLDGTEHFIKNGKEIEYDDYLLFCLVEDEYEKDGETYLVLGRNIALTEMLVGLRR